MTTLVRAPIHTQRSSTPHATRSPPGTFTRRWRSPPLSLRELRSQLPPADWALVGEQVRRHPLHDLLLESPFTRRAFEKPRGYAGDAVLMDLIYGKSHPGDDLSPLGGMLYGYEFDSPCFQSVRTRRAFLAREIDSVAAIRPRPACSRSRAGICARSNGARRREPAPWRSPPSTRTATASPASSSSTGGIACPRGRPRSATCCVAPCDSRTRISCTRRASTTTSKTTWPARSRRPSSEARPGRTAAHRQFHARHLRRGLHGIDHGLAPDLPIARGRPRAGRRIARRKWPIEQFADENRHVTYMRVVRR